jgi:hypothetical protein
MFIDSLFKEPKFLSDVGKVQRACHKNMRVRVYRNLNKTDFFSIMAIEGDDKGRVVGYARSIKLRECVFKVNEKGRQRVLSSKNKNVHAFCEGVIIDASLTHQSLLDDHLPVTYNPYMAPTFYRCDNNEPVTDVRGDVVLQQGRVHVCATHDKAWSTGSLFSDL